MERKDEELNMGTVTIQNRTTIDPISLMGEEAGICYGADITNQEGNYKRGVDCVKSNHGRTMEFPQVYMVLDGWSAKCIREFYTHIGGAPTRLQSSTRYIDYAKGFEEVVPESIANDKSKMKVWKDFISQVAPTIEKLKELGVPNEDATNVLPLAYKTKVVVRTNLRNLIDMAEMRLCNRAYWEYRKLMKDIIFALENYSEEWESLVYDLKVFQPKCEKMGFCTETRCCGKMPRKGRKS